LIVPDPVHADHTVGLVADEQEILRRAPLGDDPKEILLVSQVRLESPVEVPVGRQGMSVPLLILGVGKVIDPNPDHAASISWMKVRHRLRKRRMSSSFTAISRPTRPAFTSKAGLLMTRCTTSRVVLGDLSLRSMTVPGKESLTVYRYPTS